MQSVKPKTIPEKLNVIYKEVIKLLGLTIEKDLRYKIVAHDKKYDYYFFAGYIRVTPRNNMVSCVFIIECNTFSNYSAQKVADFIKEAFKKQEETYYTLYRGRLISEEESDASAKVFAYHGRVITASSKQEAIQKIISSPKISIKEKIYNAKSFNERELLKKVLDATKHPDEKIEIKGKGEYSSVYIIVRKGNIVNIDNVVGDLDWAGIRKNETEAKKLFNYWKQLAKKECDGKIRFRTLVNEITKENSVWHD